MQNAKQWYGRSATGKKKLPTSSWQCPFTNFTCSNVSSRTRGGKGCTAKFFFCGQEVALILNEVDRWHPNPCASHAHFLGQNAGICGIRNCTGVCRSFLSMQLQLQILSLSSHRASTTYRNGTCMTSDECGDKSGRASGNCASGYCESNLHLDS